MRRITDAIVRLEESEMPFCEAIKILKEIKRALPTDEEIWEQARDEFGLKHGTKDEHQLILQTAFAIGAKWLRGLIEQNENLKDGTP